MTKGNLDHDRKDNYARGLEASQHQGFVPDVSRISVVGGESAVVGHGRGENEIWIRPRGNYGKNRSRGWGDLSLCT